jgi:3-oxoacyl-[acyl-carrier protein] reductase
MLRRGEGRLLLLASIAAKVTLRGAAAYAASKAGVVALANSAREELRGTGVRVSVLYPGAVASPFWDSIGSDLDRRRMIPPARVAEELLRLAEEPPDATTEELTILPPDGIL